MKNPFRTDWTSLHSEYIEINNDNSVNGKNGRNGIGRIALVSKVRFVIELFSDAAVERWEGRQPAAPWMVISFAWFVFPYAWTYHTNCSFSIYDLFAFCRSFAQSFEIGRESTNVRALECEMRSMCTHPSGMKTTYHFFPPLVVVGFVFVFHLCTEPPKHSVLYARNKSYMKRCAVVENW